MTTKPRSKIGYARVSTDEQNLALQRDALAGAGCLTVYEEKASGKTADRPEWVQCQKALRAGDVLVVWRLDRLGRNLSDLVRIVNELKGRGVGFESVTERIETDSVGGTLIFHVFAALAEFERGLIAERTRAGLAAARARGRRGGRKPKVTPAIKRQIRAYLAHPDSTVAQACEIFKLSRTTIYNHLGPVRALPAVPPAKGGDR